MKILFQSVRQPERPLCAREKTEVAEGRSSNRNSNSFATAARLAKRIDNLFSRNFDPATFPNSIDLFGKFMDTRNSLVACVVRRWLGGFRLMGQGFEQFVHLRGRPLARFSDDLLYR